MMSLILAVATGATEVVSSSGASGADPSFIGQLVLALGALSAAGLGGGYLMGKRHNVNISPHPLTVREQEQYATKEDIKEIKDDIRDLKRLMRESEGSAHKRMDSIAADLNQIVGAIKLRTTIK